MFNEILTLSTYLLHRTDSGVHALHSTVHVDLQPRSGTPYHPNLITHALNQSFNRWSCDIQVLSTERVPSTFDARRHALNRTYLYRFAVSKEPYDRSLSWNAALGTQFIPIEEHNRCYFILWVSFWKNSAISMILLFFLSLSLEIVISTSIVQNKYPNYF